MGVVHASAGIEVEIITVNENGAVRGVVGPDAGATGQIEEPKYGRIIGCDGDWRRAGDSAPYLAGIQAHDFAAIADDVNAVALVFWVARIAVVGAEVDAAAGDDGSRMGFGAELSGPFDVLAGFGIEGVGETELSGDHVAGPGLAPLRLVGGAGLKATGAKGQKQEKTNGKWQMANKRFQNVQET